ncbi:MAG TPA: hypothetical protein PL110_09910 [Candidatus Eremiobacteraeota bacterium]|nr:MAG: hypothetical protein BWY64_00379 [bacterium ADurb.Bin363]HPZ08418.1 hypothetical protein [Candidatus Eremiobacteraeota bacterium]
MKINQTQTKHAQKTPDNYNNWGPDGPNRKTSDDEFNITDTYEGCSLGTRDTDSSDYFGCGDSGGGGGGAFLG